MNATEPIANEYKRLFLKPPGPNNQGDYYNLVKAYSHARVVNPLVAKSMGDVEMREAIKGLVEFGFDEF